MFEGIKGQKMAGRVVALDLGSKRVGVAVSDPTRTIAQSYGVVKRKSRKEDFARYQRILTEQQATLLVVGLPTTSEGEDSEAAVWIRNYIADFSQQADIPIVFWDESFTTVKAEESLRQRGKRGKKARTQVDAVAAAFILQSYLDAQKRA